MKTLLGVLVAIPILGGSIQGRVINSATGAGIPGIEVNACPSPATLPAPCRERETLLSAVTNGAGEFRIADLPDGQYRLMPPRKDGYFPAGELPMSIRVSGDTRLEIPLIPPA